MRLLRGIPRTEEQEAIAGQPISAGASGFLVVAFDVFRQIVVNNPAHVGFVDAHSECDRGADDARLVTNEEFLILRPLVVGEARVIRYRGESPLREALCKAICRGPRGAIDDPAIHRPRFDEVQDLLRWLVFWNDAVGEVRTVEARHENLRFTEAQMFYDILSHALCGCCRERHERNVGKPLAQLRDLAILWAEIVAPLGNAVSLINRDRRQIPGAEIFLPMIKHEALWRCVEKPVAALVQTGKAGFGLFDAERGIQKSRLHARCLKLVHLVFHQGNQRRNNQRQSFSQQRWELKAKRFATTRRQQRKCISPRQVRLHDFALQWTKSIITESDLERFLNFIHPKQNRRLDETSLQIECNLIHRNEKRSFQKSYDRPPKETSQTQWLRPKHSSKFQAGKIIHPIAPIRNAWCFSRENSVGVLTQIDRTPDGNFVMSGSIP